VLGGWFFVFALLTNTGLRDDSLAPLVLLLLARVGGLVVVLLTRRPQDGAGVVLARTLTAVGAAFAVCTLLGVVGLLLARF
jgi:hypothetical protein